MSAEDVCAAFEYAAKLAGEPVAAMPYAVAPVSDDDREMIEEKTSKPFVRVTTLRAVSTHP